MLAHSNYSLMFLLWPLIGLLLLASWLGLTLLHHATDFGKSWIHGTLDHRIEHQPQRALITLSVLVAGLGLGFAVGIGGQLAMKAFRLINLY